MIAVQDLALDQGHFSLRNISFTIPAGHYGLLMGQTGSGKTSILEMIAGLRPLLSGSVILGGRPVERLPPGARGIGYVPQHGDLFTNLTVRENLAFALSLRRTERKDVERRVHDLAEWLGISSLMNRYPFGLSGGETQRVALGRALAFSPAYLLMDEPFSSVDEATREQLTRLLLDIRKRAEITVLHVTHSRHDAQALGDNIFRLEKGKIEVEKI